MTYSDQKENLTHKTKLYFENKCNIIKIDCHGELFSLLVNDRKIGKNFYNFPKELEGEFDDNDSIKVLTKTKVPIIVKMLIVKNKEEEEKGDFYVSKDTRFQRIRCKYVYLTYND